MGQQVIVPSWADQGPAPELRELNNIQESLADGIGQSYPILGYKGKQWSVRIRGVKHNLLTTVMNNNAPVSVALPFIDMVILGQAKNKSKSYYKKFDPNVEGERPICASIDGIRPDPDVQTPQSPNCAGCPRNVFFDNPETGRKTKECSDFKRLAVAIAPNLTAHLPGGPFLEPFFLRVPPASLQSLAALGETMEARGFHFSQYVTRVQFDPNEAHPKMIFSAIQRLEGAPAAQVLELRKHSNVNRITQGEVVLPTALPGPNQYPPTTAQATPVSPAATASSMAATAPPQYTTAPPLSVPPSAALPVSGVVQPAGPTPPATAPAPVAVAPLAPSHTVPSAWSDMAYSASPPPVQTAPETATGFGTAETAPVISPTPNGAASIPTSPSSINVGDSGAAEAADTDLDARVAALMARQQQ